MWLGRLGRRSRGAGDRRACRACGPSPESVSVWPMAQVGTHRLASTVSFSRKQRGTFIPMHCVCLPRRTDNLGGESGPYDDSAVSISTPLDQIASIQPVSADDGQVLLERSL
jgi:hypothetical protein